MSINPETTNNAENKTPAYRPLLRALWRSISARWPWKLLSLMLAVVLWGGIISQDATLTREKSFTDVTVNVINRDALLRSGLIVTKGLDDLQPIKMRVDVPQKIYDSVTPANFNVRIDLSRITAPGVQTLPVMYAASTTYGTVKWVSMAEVTVEVDHYITRRRIPVQLNETGSIPAGFYATNAIVDPSIVTISGPRSLVQNVVRCVASYNTSLLSPAARTQFSAVPFVLYDNTDKPVESNLIEVSIDAIQLDTLLVEQTLYRLQAISINKSGITTGKPAKGYKVTDITIDPAMLNVAGSNELMETLTLLDVEAPIDITGATDTLIRSVKIKRPADAYHMSENAVYVTVTIKPESVSAS